MASEPFHEEGPPLASQPNNTGTTAPPPPLAPPRAAAGRPERSVPPGPAKPAPLPPRASLGGAAGACGGATLPLLPLLRPVAVPAANGASPRVLQHWTAAGVVAAQSSLGQLLAAARPPQLKPAAAAATTGVLQPATPAAAATVGVVAVPPPALTTQLPVSVLGSKRKADAAMGHTVPLLRPRDVPAVGVPMLPHPVAAAAMPVIGQPIGLVGAGLPSLFQPPAWRGGSEAGSGGAASSDDDEAAAGRGWVKGQASEAAIAADAAAALERQSYRKARLTWTQELHNRFINALSHLGLKNAVPKSILAMMNVEGMTRENVASHLQKYRLYLHRLSGLSNKDHADTDTLQCLHEQNVQAMAAQQMMQQSLVAMQGQPAASVAASIDGPAPSVGTLATPVPLMAPQAGSSFSNGSAAAAASSGLASLAAAALGPPPAAAGAAGVAGCSSNSARPMLAAGTAGVNGTVAAAGPTPPRLLPLPGSQPALVAVQPKAAGTPLAIVPGHGNPAWNGQHNAGTAATASLVVAAAVRSAIPAGSTLAGMASGPPKSNGTTCTHLLVPVTGADSRGRDIAKTSAACPTNPTE